ncbi:type VII secretion protein EssA [Oceanobacillus bengalensis]|nr:type VII secretion protein EssA [Oceanobacillus bengalensis]
MKMKGKLKQFSISVLFIFLLVFSPYQISAETAPTTPGSLELKIDRIIQGEDERTIIQETELEKVFPTLFEEETNEKIDVVEKEKERTLDALEESLFRMESVKNVTLQNIKQSLFSDNYIVTASSTSSEVNDKESNNGIGNVLLLSLTIVGCFLAGGLYLLMRKSFD